MLLEKLVDTSVNVEGKKGYTVAKVGRSSELNDPPKVTFSETLPTDLAVGDYGYYLGDYGERSVASVAEWIPISDPDSTAFFGIDRTVEIERLSGFRRVMSANESVHKAIRTLTTEVMAFSNAGFKGYFMNPFTENYLVNTIENRTSSTGNTSVQYMVDTSNPKAGQVANIGFGRLLFNSNAGQFPVYLSRFIPLGLVYGLNWDTVMFKYLAPPKEGMLDFARGPGGHSFRWNEAAMTFESRLRIYCQLFLQLPGSCFVLDARRPMKTAGY